MSSDHMSVMVDWLDHYRDQDLPALLDLYEEDARITCGCSGKMAAGKREIERYWRERMDKQIATELLDLRPDGNDIVIAYRAGEESVEARFSFSSAGRIANCRCGPIDDACRTA